MSQNDSLCSVTLQQPLHNTAWLFIFTHFNQFTHFFLDSVHIVLHEYVSASSPIDTSWKSIFCSLHLQRNLRTRLSDHSIDMLCFLHAYFSQAWHADSKKSPIWATCEGLRLRIKGHNSRPRLITTIIAKYVEDIVNFLYRYIDIMTNL